jgi:hypothetical protein
VGDCALPPSDVLELVIELIVRAPVMSVLKSKPVESKGIVAQIEIRPHVLGREKYPDGFSGLQEIGSHGVDDKVGVVIDLNDVESPLEQFSQPRRMKFARITKLQTDIQHGLGPPRPSKGDYHQSSPGVIVSREEADRAGSPCGWFSG